jgi:hypothetical protein
MLILSRFYGIIKETAVIENGKKKEVCNRIIR